MNEEKQARTLTPHEEVRAKEQAHEAFLREMGMRMPKPEAVASDYIHDNVRVVQTLKTIISVLPAFLGLIAIAAVLISADKTFSAFRMGVVNESWNAIATTLGICGVVMTEVGLVYVEFAIVRERLKKGLRRHVFNLKDVRRWWRVFKGEVDPRDYHEMPDSSLIAYSRLIFGVVLAANVFGAYKATERADDPSVAFALALGVAGAFSLRFIGAQLAHITYEIMEQERREMMAEIDQAWRVEMDRRWALVEDELTARAMHRAYIVKNNLDLEAGSPYLLGAGEGGELEAVPFEQTISQTLSQHES